MYEYIIRKATNEARLEEQINLAAAEGWEVVSYAIRQAGGIWFLLFSFYSDHYVVMRRRKD
jgi:hypothetical protein